MLELLDKLAASTASCHRMPSGSKFIDQCSTQSGGATGHPDSFSRHGES